VVRTHKISKEQRLQLAFVGYVLGKLSDTLRSNLFERLRFHSKALNTIFKQDSEIKPRLFSPKAVSIIEQGLEDIYKRLEHKRLESRLSFAEDESV